MATPITRVESDGGGRRTTYEEIEVGADLGQIDWSVSAEAVKGLLQNDDDHHEWYVDSSPFGSGIVPPMATYPPVRILFTRKYNVRGLFYWFEHECVRPLFYGQKVSITGRIIEKWIKRDREYVKYEAEGRDEAGKLLFRTRRAHVLDFIPRTAPRAGVGLDSGRAQ